MMHEVHCILIKHVVELCIPDCVVIVVNICTGYVLVKWYVCSVS